MIESSKISKVVVGASSSEKFRGISPIELEREIKGVSGGIDLIA
jgi:hypothetical protein